MNRTLARSAWIAVGAMLVVHCADVVAPVDGGTGGTSGTGGAIGPKVLSTIPADGATEVPVETTVSATVDVALDPASVSGDSLRVERDSGITAGEVMLDNSGTAVTFTPEAPLALLGEYTATLNGVSSLSGAPLAEPESWQFTVREGSWGTPRRIESNNSGSANDPQVAMNPSGNAVAVWMQSAGPFNIWSNRYTPSGGWETAELIEWDDTGSAGEPQVAIDESGNALAVWSQLENIWSNRYTPGTGWETPVAVGAAGSNPQVAIDPSGNALAVWGQLGTIYSNRYTPSGGWETSEIIGAGGAGGAGASNPQVAIEPGGNALAVWSQPDNIWSNSYSPSGGWETAVAMGAGGAGGSNPQVAIDPNGNALAVWEQDDGMRFNIWSNRYTPSGGWETAEAEPIESGDSTAGRPQVAIDARGNGLAVWHQSSGGSTNVWSNRYTPSGGWQTAEAIGLGGDAQVAIDPSGNAVAVWRQSGTNTNIWRNRYTPSGGWETAEPMETEEREGFGPQVAVDPRGNSIAVWEKDDGIRYNIWANRFE